MKRYRVLVGAGVTLLISALPVVPAYGLTLFHFRGTVADAVGRPLAAATVSDGQQNVTTDGSGRYDLPEGSTGGYSLRAWRGDTTTATKNVDATLPLDQIVDFTLLYQLSSSLSRTAISTADGQANAILTVTTFAPLPGLPGDTGNKSCVFVTDSRTGLTTSASLSGTDAGTGVSSWKHDLELPQGTAEGSYTLSAIARDCSSGVGLAPSSPVPYVVDNTAPTLLPETLVPLDVSNSVFGSGQPLEVKLGDTGGSGIDPTSIVFKLTDEDGAATTHSGVWSSTTGWAKTVALSLVSGRVYTIEVSARDRAGNATTVRHSEIEDGGGFLVTSLVLEPTGANIPPTVCTVSDEIDIQTGMKTATCPNVPLNFASTSVTLEGARRGGETGFVDHRVTLETAVVSTTVAGVPVSLPAYRESDPAWQPKTAALPFDVPNPVSASTSFPVSARSVNIGTLTAKVPPTWTTASLEMGATTTTPSHEACADPSTSSGPIPCVPDPLQSRYVTLLDASVSDPAAVAAEHAAGG